MMNRDMKVSDISKQSEIVYSTIKSILENGTGKASYINICKICSSLGITPDELEYMAKGNYKAGRFHHKSKQNQHGAGLQ